MEVAKKVAMEVAMDVAMEVAMEVAEVGKAILSSHTHTLLGKLRSVELHQFACQENLDADLPKWEKILKKIYAVLEDAEEKQMTTRSVKIWLDELRDLTYDVEDVLDEFSTEALRRKLTQEPEASTSKVRNLILTWFTGLNSRSAMFKVKMGSKINEITTRLQEIAVQKNALELREDAGERSGRVRDRLPTTSLVNESHVSGREEDKAAILELIKAEASDSQVSVIPIYGMGGVGKTTLAQLVYNDTEVKFDLKAWVCVSEIFDIPSITKTVLQSVTAEISEGNDLNLLQVKLKEKLTGKKFLIVLDDVWNDNYENWTLLRVPFEAGAQGSKIIVTTRNQHVSSMMVSSPTDPTFHLKELSSDDCLSILAQHALGERNFDRHPNVKAIGEEIARRCKGLPLAAKALGGVMRAKQNQDKWVDILNSKIWEEGGSILPALRLSYHHLPSPLKQCFAYCAVFPKDYEFDRDELVLLWMAEGFLQQPRGNKQIEEMGHEYFGDLLSRSFFQQTDSDNTRFVMHDLIHDLAQSVSGETCFILDDKLKSKTFEKARHSSFICHGHKASERFEVYNTSKSLRTFIALPLTRGSSRGYPYYKIRHMVLHDLLPKLICLRVLSLSDRDIDGLPYSIGELKHLRYLNLSGTRIKWLPESVSDLYNLQVLLLHNCKFLPRLPQSIGNLINLRHLDIAGTDKLQEMPLGIGSLISLQKLSKFVVGKGDGLLKLKELKDLLHLQGELSITGLHNVVDIQDARIANLKDKHGLDELSMVWGDELPMLWRNNFNDILRNEVLRNEEDEMCVLDMLQPHPNLKGLTIAFFGGKKFPSWMGDPSFTNIVRIHLRCCRKVTSLPTLGRLPSLRNLRIEGMDRVKCVGLEFYGDTSLSIKPFPSLETLLFQDMLEWEEWYSSTSVDEPEFPRLRELEILNCPKLFGKLPGHLISLVKLGIRNCPQLVYSPVRLPSLCELNLEECNEVVIRSMADLTSLTTLRLMKISEFTCLHEGLMQFLVALQVLEIQDCGEMTTFWQNKAGLENLACLKQLVIRGCPKLVSFPEGGVPSSLRRLVVSSCKALESLPDEMMMHSSNNNNCLLENVEIYGCPSLKSFPRGKLPTTLKRLIISWCKNLQSFPNERMMHENNSGVGTPHLEELTISDCPSLTFFQIEEFPTALKRLEISNCTQLEESVLERMLLQNSTSLEYIHISNWTKLKSLPDCLNCLTHLTYLWIHYCPALESFPESGLLIPNLISLYIDSCIGLKSLPKMQGLISLQDLGIWSCPNIVSFPEGGLPPNLTSLTIKYCKNLKQPMSDWGLHRLTSLTSFEINCAVQDMVSFPDDEHDCPLPTSLTTLEIKSFPNLETLSKGLQNLTSLKRLLIYWCPKLQSLPKEGLPATLESLHIVQCPLLKQRCLMMEGEYWPIIAHIPDVNLL